MGTVLKKMSHKAGKNSKVVPFSLARYCMLRGEKGNTFLFQFLGPTDTIWHLPLNPPMFSNESRKTRRKATRREFSGRQLVGSTGNHLSQI